MSKLGHYDYHPAYRGDAYWVAQDEKFGRDRNQVPTEEMEVGRGGPFFTGRAAFALDPQGVNPVAAIFEPLTDDMFGAGFDEALLDEASFVSVSNAIANTSNFKISVLQTDQTDMRSYLSAVLEYFDGFLYRKGSTIALGYWAQGDIDTDVLPVVGSDDLTSEPRLKSSGYDDCYTEVNVIFCDREHYFHDAVATYRNPGMYEILGEFRSITLQRKFIIDKNSAQQYATQWGQRFSRPGINGELDVKLEKVEEIEGTGSIIGKLIKTDSASLGFEFVFRIIECEYPADDGPFFCTLTVELERSIWPEIYIQPPPDKIGNFVVNVPAIKNYRLWELPSGLKNGSGLQIGILAQRPAKSIVGFHVWDSADNITFAALNPPYTFAAYGTLTVAYPSSTATDDVTVGMTFKLFGVDLVPDSTNHRLDYTVLCFVDGEIMSVGRLTALGGGVYNTWMWRARYGTIKATHAIGAKAYFILRENLAPLSDKKFVLGDTIYFKLQTYDNKQEFDLADFPSFSHLFNGNAVAVPTGLTLTTTFVLTTERTVDSRITASWSFVDDQDISGFDVRVRRLTLDASWTTVHVGSNVNSQLLKGLEPNKLYEVQVRALSWTGEPSAWSASEQITTAAPNIPGIPTGFDVKATVTAAQLSWNDATTWGIRGTIILFGFIPDDLHLAEIAEVPIGEESFVDTYDTGLGAQVFFAVKHVNTLGVEGSRTAIQGVYPLTEAPVTKLPSPFIAKSDLEGGAAGSADFRLQIVNTSAGQDALLQFSYNKTSWTTYSATGNYRDGISGSVLPTTNVGEISLSAGGQLFARQTQVGFLTSEVAAFYNNTSKTPHSDGSGGGDGTPGKHLP